MERRRASRRWLAVGIVATLLMLVASCGSSSKGTSGPTTSTTEPGAFTPTTRPSVSAGASQLAAADGAANDHLGGAYYYDTFAKPITPQYYATPGEAAMSSNGQVALVGAPGHAGDGKTGAGAAYVFAKQGDHWSQVAQLVAPNAGQYDGFGWSVALSGDGTTALIGSPYHDDGKNQDLGAAYVFHNSGGHWSQVTALRGKDSAAYDGFGWAVAFARDGHTLIVGAPSHKVGSMKGAGAAYVFHPATGGAGWTEVHELTEAKPAAEGNFGTYVALSSNSSTALVTRQTHSDASKVLHQGATFIFRSADAWKSSTGVAVFPDTNRNANGVSDQYGVNAVLSDDGRVAAVAAPDVNLGKSGGAGTTFVYMTTGEWAAPAKNTTITLLPTAPVPFGYFGSSVALSSNGLTLFIGVDNTGSNSQGSGVLVALPTPATATTSHAPLVQTPIPPPHTEQGRFGTAVAMSADGAALLSTSPWLAVGHNQKQGAAFVLDGVKTTRP
jgi:hypothetical protein